MLHINSLISSEKRFHINPRSPLEHSLEQTVKGNGGGGGGRRRKDGVKKSLTTLPTPLSQPQPLHGLLTSTPSRQPVKLYRLPPYHFNAL